MMLKQKYFYLVMAMLEKHPFEINSNNLQFRRNINHLLDKILYNIII